MFFFSILLRAARKFLVSMGAIMAVIDAGAPSAADSSDSDGDRTKTMKEIGGESKWKYFPLHKKVKVEELSKPKVKKAYMKWEKAAFTQKVLMTTRLACTWPKMLVAIRELRTAKRSAERAKAIAKLARPQCCCQLMLPN